MSSSSWEKYYNIFQLLFSHDSDLINRVQCTKPSTLYMACAFGVLKMVKLLFDLGADVGDLYRMDDSGLSYWSSLITIISSGSLLSAAASKQTSHHDDIIDLLCQVEWSENEKILSLLVQKGLDVNHKDRSGSFALGIASREGHTKLVECLLKSRKANVNQQDNDGISSLMYASSGGYMPISRQLLRYHARLDLQDKKGWSALMFAVVGEHTDLIVYLLGEGAQVNIQDVHGTSPLMLSCFTGHVRVTKILLAHDADINLQNSEGITALMMSSYNGHTEIVELLVKYRADIDAVTSIGKSALDFSKDKGHDKVSKLLIEYGARERRDSNLGKRILSMRDPNITSEESVTYTSSSYPQMEERPDRMDHLQNIAINSAMRLDRIEQILQTLLQNQTSNSTMTPPAAKRVNLSLKPTLREASAVTKPHSLRLAQHWHVMLNLENDALKVIKYDCHDVAKDCLREMLSQWLNCAIPPPTWEELAEALEDADHKSAARKIRRV